jgi:hypothetical protein
MAMHRVIGVGYDDAGDLKSMMDFVPTAKSHTEEGYARIVFHNDSVEADSWSDAVAKYTRQYVEACEATFPKYEYDGQISMVGLPRLFIEREPIGETRPDLVPDIEFPDHDPSEFGLPAGIDEVDVAASIPEWYREVKGEDVPMDVLEKTDSGFLDSDFMDSGDHLPHSVYTLGAAARSFVAIYNKIQNNFGQKLFEMTGDRAELTDEPGPSIDIEFTPEELATFAEHQRQIERGWKWKSRWSCRG